MVWGDDDGDDGDDGDDNTGEFPGFLL